jgi:hypothetical protein
MAGEARLRGRRNGGFRQRVADRPAPLSFILQLDLAALAAAGSIDPDVPREGRLLFFYDIAELPWGFRPADRVGSRLAWDVLPPGDLVRHAVPAEIAEEAPAPLAVRARATLAPPGTGSEAILDFLGDDDADVLADWILRNDGHRFGGRPSEIQRPMEPGCVLVSRGFSVVRLDPPRRSCRPPLRQGPRGPAMRLTRLPDRRVAGPW